MFWIILGVLWWLLIFWAAFYEAYCLSVSLIDQHVGFDGLVSFIFDNVSFICLYMLCLCGGLALVYCFHYISGDTAVSLFILMVWFLCVMAFLMISGNVYSTLICWEYLGLSSVFLILYYLNGSSLRAAVVTIFSSRFGDVGLFLLLAWSCNCSNIDYNYFSLYVIMAVVFLTKSAGYPFFTWLVEAMRAPTPVSAAVHSSTLVAAGMWFVFRYHHFLGPDVLDCLYLLCVLTIVVSGVCALVFNDLKKLAALSTCSNLSWCFVFFALSGDVDLALYQLVIHGLSKAYLFMAFGDLMGCSGGNQGFVGVYMSRYLGCFTVLAQCVLIFSLCGLPFLGAFFIKHYLFARFLFSIDIASCFTLFACIVLTYAYSFRLVLLLNGSKTGSKLAYSSLFSVYVYFAIIALVVSYLFSIAAPEIVGVDYVASLMLVLSEFVGVSMGVWVFYKNEVMTFSYWISEFAGSDSFVDVLRKFFSKLMLLSTIGFYRLEFHILYWLRFDGGEELYGYSVSFILSIIILLILYLLVLFCL
uniref:NADH:ubiquinone reductase (H(+)-translocating) n=1 Tax=Eurytrema pancreaticum TaxID=374591 RepID=A0A0E3U2H3_EUTPN|nr:NADH dehydrogenase subunit 5 [Eurytrema pancreaticum]